MLNVQLAISKCQIIYYANLNNERVIIENCVTILHLSSFTPRVQSNYCIFPYSETVKVKIVTTSSPQFTALAQAGSVLC